MIHKRIFLPCRHKESNGKKSGFKPYITTYILENSPEIDVKRKRPLILFCPGDGYSFTSDREAEPIALRLNALGFHVCILRYSTKPFDFPAPLLDLCQAMQLIRNKKQEWHIDDTKIIVGGCSAGGHLAACLGVFWNNPLIQTYQKLNIQDIKPNGLLLCYPVITTDKTLTHGQTIENIVGNTKDMATIKNFMSLEKHISSSTPPTFLWHTWDDTIVPVENSLLFASGLKKHAIPAELHIFSSGPHGLSLASKETAKTADMIVPECQLWPELFANWLTRL